MPLVLGRYPRLAVNAAPLALKEYVPAFNTDMLLHWQSGTIAVRRRRVAELLIDVQRHHGMNFPNRVFLRFSSSV
jgi:hypothetical protein